MPHREADGNGSSGDWPIGEHAVRQPTIEVHPPYGATMIAAAAHRPHHSLALLLLAAVTTAQAPLPEPPAPPPVASFATRRVALAKAIVAAHPEREVVVLVRGAEKAADMGPFVQDQDFLYLTGVNEPDLALLLLPARDGSLAVDELLVPPFSRFAATWDGNFLAPGDNTAQRTGFAAATNVRALAERLDALLAERDGQRPLLVLPTRPAARLGSTPSKAADAAAQRKRDAFDGRPSREAALADALGKRYPGLQTASLEQLLHPLRAIKDEAELDQLRASTQAACEGIAEAMRCARPGLYEFQLAAAARYVFSLRGAGPDAYAAIVGAGANGCILHYNACNKRLEQDDLIVMDYAPTMHGYASDVTRTFPASGTFSPAQRQLVQDVHAIQQELIAMVKPGARLSDMSRRCSELLRDRGYRNDHGPCHHVGLAVHDPSAEVLAPGMVITVEPGAYLRDQGMGCRIEDVVLVTANGHEVLSKGCPSDPDAIEALMRQPGVVDVEVGTRR